MTTIVICGLGTLGRSLISYFSQTNWEVIVVDNDPKKIALIEQQFDVRSYLGSAENVTSLRSSGISAPDVVICATQVDALNILTCQLFDQFFATKIKIARLHNPEYFLHQVDTPLTPRTLYGVDHILSPYHGVDQLLYHKISNPWLYQIPLSITHNKNLITLRASHLTRHFASLSRLAETLRQEFEAKLAVVIDQDRIISDLQLPIEPHYLLLIVASNTFSSLAALFCSSPTKEVHLLIAGANNLAFHVTQSLLHHPKVGHITLVDSDKQLAQTLYRSIPQIHMIHGNALNEHILQEANIEHVDHLIAATTSDRSNLLISNVAANHFRVPHTSTLVSCPDYLNTERALNIQPSINLNIDVMLHEALLFITHHCITSVLCIPNTPYLCITVLVQDQSLVENILHLPSLRTRLLLHHAETATILIETNQIDVIDAFFRAIIPH